MPNTTLRLPAFAKINPSLRVLGKRPDGYHELDILLQTISLHDTITFTITDSLEIVLTCDDRSLSIGSDNLVYRAAKSLQETHVPEKGARIHLEKRIPTEAGLGGGSADAAVTLGALAYLWQSKVRTAELLELSIALGADVPFFLGGGMARGTGIGNMLRWLDDAPEQHLLVIKPNEGISTADAYAALKARSLTSTDAKTILSSSDRSEVSSRFDIKALHNDFEPAVFELEPEIKRAKVALSRVGAATVLLAGSGSAIFGIFDSEDAQQRAIQVLEIEAGWRVFPCRTIGRNSYRSAMGEASEIFSAVG